MRFITASCYHRLQLFGRAAIRDVFVDALIYAREEHRFELFAWVVMPEHVHLLLRPCHVRPPAAPIPLAPMLVSLKQTVSQRVLPDGKPCGRRY
ncbi:MAG TPA: hypothetical protein VG816_10695 [Solirubrobacterales bacterium]|nr:hypothetical protein [Solirubrobacterales bacterium]